jgi:hypothetical protein
METYVLFDGIGFLVLYLFELKWADIIAAGVVDHQCNSMEGLLADLKLSPGDCQSRQASANPPSRCTKLPGVGLS